MREEMYIKWRFHLYIMRVSFMFVIWRDSQMFQRGHEMQVVYARCIQFQIEIFETAALSSCSSKVIIINFYFNKPHPKSKDCFVQGALAPFDHTNIGFISI